MSRIDRDIRRQRQDRIRDHAKYKKIKRKQDVAHRKIDKRKYYGIGVEQEKYEELIKDGIDFSKVENLLQQVSEGLNDIVDDIAMAVAFPDLYKTQKLIDIVGVIGSCRDKGGRRLFDTEGNRVEVDKEELRKDTDAVLSEQKGYLQNLEQDTRDKIRNDIRQGQAEGKSISEMRDDILEDAEDMAKHRAETIARTETIRASAEGTEKAIKASGAEHVIWMATEDKRTCDICKDYNKSRWEVDDPKRPKPVEDTHPNCFDKETEVLTKDGWKYFKDVEEGDMIFSLNPGNEEVGWKEAIEKIQYNYQGNMIHFYNNYNFDCMVTPDHNFWYRTKSINLKKSFAQSLVDKYYFQIPRTANYKSDKDMVWINGKEYNGKEIMRFMGWYLSEGSTTKRKDNEDYYQISLEQKDTSKIEEDLEFMEDELRIGESTIYIFDHALGKYLYKLGKSWEKYLPEKFKELNKECLKEFLDTYIKGDGSIRERDKQIGGYDMNEERVYFTSSDKLASDIGELLVKIGKYPSYRKDKAREHNFRNGTYKTKHPCWRIRECSRESVFIKDKYGERELKEYDDKVYDVELEDWHILYVRRNGKCYWSGNCRCTVIADL